MFDLMFKNDFQVLVDKLGYAPNNVPFGDDLVQVLYEKKDIDAVNATNFYDEPLVWQLNNELNNDELESLNKGLQQAVKGHIKYIGSFSDYTEDDLKSLIEDDNKDRI